MELHRHLATLTVGCRSRPSTPMLDVAIVGMAAVFPGAPDLATFWANIVGGVDAISDAPPARLDPELARALPSTRGGFVAPTFDPVAFGIMPNAAASAEPDQLLALAVAAAALADARGAVARSRTGVIFGRGGYLTPAMARLVNRVRTAPQLTATLAELLPDLDPAVLARVRDAFAARAGDAGAAGDAIGLVPNLAASRVANRLDLRGPAYTLDAACASALVAIDHACSELVRGRCDAMIAGGVHVCHDITLWSVFAQLGALSRTAAIRPFDRRADGILIGEGCGALVLKRLADAERDGDRIYAVIRGSGVASDGRESSAMRPRADGQLAALAMAWHGLPPESVGLIEAHGTATPTGDEVELGALAQQFGSASGPRAALGSVKSMIGHAMPAAGAAGIIKAALAVHHGVWPPSLHCDEPHAGLAATRFRVPARAEEWDAVGVRRAGVSAFGFGGINAHVVLDGHAASAPARGRRPSATTTRDATSDVFAVARNNVDELFAALDGGEPGTTGAMRLVMFDPTAERRALARKVLERGTAWRGKSDIWFNPQPLAHTGGKLALIFPGVEATFAASIDDVARTLDVASPDAIADAAHATGASARDLERRGLGVFALGKLLHTYLARIGVRADAVAGHSLGEWTGMVATEMIPPAAADAFVASLNAGTLDVPDVVFAAVGCGAIGAREAIAGLADITVSHDNCPHQSIVCGKSDAVTAALARLAARGVLCQELPFRSGFHSPLFASHVAPHRAHLAALALQPPRVPLWSATTCAPYPSEPAAIRALALEHLVTPVRFRELVEALYAHGVRVFVQVGVGSVASFVEDTLRGRDHVAIAAASARHAGLAQLDRVQAALWVDGFVPAPTRASSAASAPPASPPTVASRSTMPLELGVPLIHIADVVGPLSLATVAARDDVPRDGGGDPVLAELLATLDEATAATRAIGAAYRASKLPSSHTVHRALSAATEPALLDHCFYRQPAAWPVVSDRYPVVPMTMTIAMMIDAARALVPGRVAIAVEEVRAFRWLAVAPPIDIDVVATRRPDEPDVVDIDIAGYANASVRFADAFPAPPPRSLAPLVAPRPAALTARRMYDERWMFHGPAYQGVSSLDTVGDDGVDGAIDVLPAPGALLDCAGQLMGWWVMQHETRDRLAMPVRIERIALYAPEPPVGTRVPCRVRMRELGEREVRADLELDDPRATGRLWATIDGWHDRRFDSDEAVWAVLMYPELNVLAEQHADHVLVREHWRGAASRELMMRRYLGEREREQHDRLDPRARRGWLLSRIAIKDAVRMRVWRSGRRPIYPVEIQVSDGANGRPQVAGAHAGLRVAVAIGPRDDIAAAVVGESGGREIAVAFDGGNVAVTR
jgi:acyl transferase domain-containing protein